MAEDAAGREFTELDLTDPTSIRKAIVGAKPDAIVSAAAYTAVDKAESKFDLDPPPLKWSALKYGFESLKEDGYGKTPQARRDCREAAAG